MRTFNGVDLTEDGEELYRRFRKILSLVYETQELFGQRRKEAVKQIRLAFSFGTQSVFFDQLDAFEQRHDLRLTITDHADVECETLLRNGEADLITTAMPVEDEQFECVKVYQSPLLIAVPQEHRLVKKNSLEISDLEGETMLTLPDNFYSQRTVMDCLHEAGVHPNIASQTSNLSYLLEAVRKNKGLSPIAKYAEGFAESLGIRVIPVNDARFCWTLYASWSKNTSAMPVMKMLLKELFSI